jgi:hypothetical protein
MQEISWVGTDKLASQEGVCSMEFVSTSIVIMNIVTSDVAHQSRI